MLEKLLIIFFGPDNDMVREPIKGYDGDKSEVHKAIEKHVGHEFSIAEAKVEYDRALLQIASLNS